LIIKEIWQLEGFFPELFNDIKRLLTEPYEIPFPKVNNFKEAVLGDLALA
jgi:hypothetical protein